MRVIPKFGVCGVVQAKSASFCPSIKNENFKILQSWMSCRVFFSATTLSDLAASFQLCHAMALSAHIVDVVVGRCHHPIESVRVFSAWQSNACSIRRSLCRCVVLFGIHSMWSTPNIIVNVKHHLFSTFAWRYSSVLNGVLEILIMYLHGSKISRKTGFWPFRKWNCWGVDAWYMYWIGGSRQDYPDAARIVMRRKHMAVKENKNVHVQFSGHYVQNIYEAQQSFA